MCSSDLRRLPFIICTDATRDTDYSFADMATLVRNVRVDFGAEVVWVDPKATKLPDLVAQWVNVEQVGRLDEIKGNKAQGGPGTKHAALARIAYADKTEGWLLLIKASLTGAEVLDVTQYAAANAQFPQDCFLCGAAGQRAILCDPCEKNLPRLASARCPICSLDRKSVV